MSDTRQLITRIAAFRERLAQASQLKVAAEETVGEVAERVAADPDAAPRHAQNARAAEGDRDAGAGRF